MKSIRVLMALALLGAAACSSPTAPRLPNPDGDDRKPPPDKPGLIGMTVPSPAAGHVGVTFLV